MSKYPPSANRPSFAPPSPGTLANSFGPAGPADALNLETLAVDTLVPSTFNRMRSYSEEKLASLADSIREHGLLHPIIVRTIVGKPGTYEILAGHNRVEACKRIGKLSIVARVFRHTDDDQAIIISNVTNLEQREFIYPMDKARSYQDLLSALKNQGARNDLIDLLTTSSPLETKSGAYEVITSKTGDSRAQIARYIRLNNLINELQNMVDDESIGLRVAVELSFLSPENQKMVSDYISTHKYSISLEQARDLRTEEKLSNDKLLSILAPKASMKQKTTSQSFTALLQQLRKAKKITIKEKSEMQRLAEEAAQKAADDAIRTYLLSAGKLDDEIEQFLDERLSK